MPDYSKYIPQVKVFVAFSAEQLNEKTNKFIDKLVAYGADTALIKITAPSIIAVGKGYVICHSVSWYIRVENTDSNEE